MQIDSNTNDILRHFLQGQIIQLKNHSTELQNRLLEKELKIKKMEKIIDQLELYKIITTFKNIPNKQDLQNSKIQIKQLSKMLKLANQKINQKDLLIMRLEQNILTLKEKYGYQQQQDKNIDSAQKNKIKLGNNIGQQQQKQEQQQEQEQFYLNCQKNIQRVYKPHSQRQIQYIQLNCQTTLLHKIEEVVYQFQRHQQTLHNKLQYIGYSLRISQQLDQYQTKHYFQQYKNLKSLKLYGNNITYLPNLQKNQKIQYIDVGYNKLIQIVPFSDGVYQNLKELYLNQNKIQVLPGFNARRLEILSVYYNSVKDIELFVQKEYPNLRELYLGQNFIQKIPELKTAKLKTFFIQCNPINNIEDFLKSTIQKEGLQIFIDCYKKYNFAFKDQIITQLQSAAFKPTVYQNLTSWRNSPCIKNRNSTLYRRKQISKHSPNYYHDTKSLAQRDLYHARIKYGKSLQRMKKEKRKLKLPTLSQWQIKLQRLNRF